MKIGDLAQQTGLSTKAIRYYEDIGVLPDPARSSNGYRSYDSGAVDMNIRGDVELKGGEVFYFDRSFYFRTGMIRFNETIDNFDPHLSVRAEIRERDENDEEVKIYLKVENETMSEYSPRFL